LELTESSTEFAITHHTGDNKTHRGFAFIEFESPEDAKEAIDNMHLSELNGKVIKVTLAKPSKLQNHTGSKAGS
jgi:peptidyl-prolyl isomerase E (cyclophilin E)